MKNLNLESAIKKYNEIMNHCGYEHCTIGTDFSEDTDDWNLRDMVAEMDYVLSTYYESGHCNGDMRYGDDDERKAWRNDTARIKRFITKYASFVTDMTCAAGHCWSKYDNHRIRLRAN